MCTITQCRCSMDVLRFRANFVSSDGIHRLVGDEAVTAAFVSLISRMYV